MIKLTDGKGLITKEAVNSLKAHAPSTTCECPKFLIDIFQQVQAFTEYQKRCMAEKPNDVYIHEWLASNSATLEVMLSGTILQLAHLEGMINPVTGEILPVKTDSPTKK